MYFINKSQDFKYQGNKPTESSIVSSLSYNYYRLMSTSSCSSYNFDIDFWYFRSSCFCSYHYEDHFILTEFMLFDRNSFRSWSDYLLMKESWLIHPRRMCKSFWACSASYFISCMSYPSLAIWLWTGRFMEASCFLSSISYNLNIIEFLNKEKLNYKTNYQSFSGAFLGGSGSLFLGEACSIFIFLNYSCFLFIYFIAFSLTLWT